MNKIPKRFQLLLYVSMIVGKMLVCAIFITAATRLQNMGDMLVNPAFVLFSVQRESIKAKRYI